MQNPNPFSVPGGKRANTTRKQSQPPVEQVIQALSGHDDCPSHVSQIPFSGFVLHSILHKIDISRFPAEPHLQCAPQPVEERRERTGGFRAARIPIAAGSVYGNHGCSFCGRNPQDFSKIWEVAVAGSLLLRPPACQKSFLEKLWIHIDHVAPCLFRSLFFMPPVELKASCLFGEPQEVTTTR